MALKLKEMANVPQKKKLFLMGLVCLMLVVGYYYLFYAATAVQIKTLDKKLADLEHEIKQQEIIAKNLPSFKMEVKRLEEQLALLLEQLPNSSEIPSLLKNITDLGRESGLEFVKFAPSAESRKNFYAEIPVSIVVKGNYNGYVLFADKVSHLPRIVNLSNISFSGPKAEGEDYVVNVNCTATTYRFLEQAMQEQAPATGKEKKPPAKGKAK